MLAKIRLALAALLLLITNVTALAQSNGPDSTIRVATRAVPPLVLENGGKLSGFSIDLWNAIAERLDLKTEYVTEPDVKSLLGAVRSGKAVAAISAISITAEREREFEFSLPMLDAGLQILVRGDSTGIDNPLAGLARVLFSKTLLIWLGIAAILVIVPAHLVWFIERNHNEGIVGHKSYFPGIFHAMWWATATLAAQADQMPRHWLARVLAILWMFVGIVFVAYYTAQLTASLTMKEIRGAITGPSDLPGKKVATTRGSTAANYLRTAKVQVLEFGGIGEAYDALLSGTADAVVFDAPVLQHYAAHAGSGRVRVVGPVFRKEDYGIVFTPGNPLRREVNATLLTLKEDGTYQRLHDHWFRAESAAP